MPVARYSDVQVAAGATRLHPLSVRIEFAAVLALLLAMLPLYLRTLRTLWHAVQAQRQREAEDAATAAAAAATVPAIAAAHAHKKAPSYEGGDGFVPHGRTVLSDCQLFWANDTARTAVIHLASLLCQLPWMLAVLILADGASINRHGWNSVLCAFALCTSVLCRWRTVVTIGALFRSLERVLDKSPEAKLGIAFQLRLSKISAAAFMLFGPICACSCLALVGFFDEETSERLLLAYLVFQSAQLAIGPFTSIKLFDTIVHTLSTPEMVRSPTAAPRALVPVKSAAVADGPISDISLSIAIDSPSPNAVAPVPAAPSAFPGPTQLLYLQATARLVAAQHALFPSFVAFSIAAAAILLPYTRERYTCAALLFNLMPQIANYKITEMHSSQVLHRAVVNRK